MRKKQGMYLLLKGNHLYYETSQYTGGPGSHDRKPLDRQ
jgi:hypothetical protein